jgi:Family of unknown function (DUF5681)
MDEKSKPSNERTSKLGYGNPPEHSRYKKGQSGNLRGRPKGKLNMATLLEQTLREKVVLTENGRQKTVSKLEAALKQLTDQATSGNLKALQVLAALVRSSEERGFKASAPDSALDEFDEKVVVGILDRLEAGKKGGQENETDKK